MLLGWKQGKGSSVKKHNPKAFFVPFGTWPSKGAYIRVAAWSPTEVPLFFVMSVQPGSRTLRSLKDKTPIGFFRDWVDKAQVCKQALVNTAQKLALTSFLGESRPLVAQLL